MISKNLLNFVYQNVKYKYAYKLFRTQVHNVQEDPRIFAFLS